MCCYTELLADVKVGRAFVWEGHFPRVSLEGAFPDVRFAASPSENVPVIREHFGLLGVVVVRRGHVTSVCESGSDGVGAVECFTRSCWYRPR